MSPIGYVLFVLRWVGLALALFLVVFGARKRTRWAWAAREVAIGLFAYFFYFLVRGFTEGGYDRAVENAERLINFEKTVGIFREGSFQSLVVSHGWSITLSNWIYIWGHWPFIAVIATWLLLYHPDTYVVTRNAFLLSGAVGLVVFASFPVAPPRLVDIGLIDTVTEHSHAYRVLQPQGLVNQVAAMPSLHFGWNLIIGIALVRLGRGVVKAIGFISPVLMAFAVVATANHYIIDAIVGGLLCLVALAVAQFFARHHPAWWDRLDIFALAHLSGPPRVR